MFECRPQRLRNKNREITLMRPIHGNFLAKGERLVGYAVNTVMITIAWAQDHC